MEAGTTVQITMPQMGDSVTEGTVLEWLKQVGDQVEPNETLLEVSTDKVDAEVPAPVGGTLVRILVEADETVPVGTVLGEIDTNGASGKWRTTSGRPAMSRRPWKVLRNGTPERVSNGRCNQSIWQ